MNTDIEIRRACEEDAEAISRVILAALRGTNSPDYSPAVIERVARRFSPEAVRILLNCREVFVAIRQQIVVGTASLEGATVRSVFVAPEAQGAGIGRVLMSAVVTAACSQAVELLRVPSSVTAEGFYSRLGFKRVREQRHGDELTIVMELPLKVR